MSTYVQSQVIAFPRMYYREEKLFGNPVETKIININTFGFILQHAQAERYKSTEKCKLVFRNGDFESVKIDMFNYCAIRNDNFTYNTHAGHFYLPDAIFLFDVSDYAPFPSEFYFIAKINNQVEICRCNGGKGIEWHQLPGRCTIVEDAETIRKIEETIDDLKGRIEYDIAQVSVPD